VQGKCRLNRSLSSSSEQRKTGITVAVSAQIPSDFNTLRVVGGRAHEACAKVTEGVRVDQAQEG
jgi:hypothetical protein